MNVIEWYRQSELALAAYAPLVPGTPDVGALKDEGRGMSSPQAAEFAETYTVIDQFTHSTSVSATIFEKQH